ncbi:MAG: elongation factor 4 [SAR86 cluster bacterium]|nr:elongation factor 4 [SAR86 cluster bacterium]MDA0899734.1 translation elongation factor 4 [Pseudomonadota bacterium]
MSNTRNFSIIAHIDHGKSTLSDRIIEFCGGLSKREMKSQVLDTLELERERGITIKAQSVSLTYKNSTGEYNFNLIDTPGHVDFSYEVSRSLAACEGALLVVDGSQGVEAQTLSTCYKAIDLGLDVIPVINKIDLPQADPDRVKREIEEIIGIDASDAICVSAKDGTGLTDLLDLVVKDIPPPKDKSDDPLQALIIDSWYDNFLGVVSLIRVFSGSLKRGEKFIVKSTGQTFTADTLGIFTPKKSEKQQLSSGQVGFLVANVKELKSVPVGDTVISAKLPETKALDGFEKVQPQVFASFYPIDSNEYQAFREALQKLSLNDSSIVFEPENSEILGSGFRCGFLGTLHMEVIKERLEREYGLSLITTAPSVAYEISKTNGEELVISSPSQLPTTNEINEIREPMIKSTVLCPDKYVGDVIELAMSKRGIQKDLQYLGGQVSLTFDMPLSEIVMDFFDILKSKSQGYASVDFVFDRYQHSDLVKVDVAINGLVVDSLSAIMHRSDAQRRGREIAKRLKDVIPRQMFEIPIQIMLGSKIIARESVKAFRKNVTAKLYGGDVTRKKKLLEKQKAGKKKMKQIGKVALPQEAFLSFLSNEKK